MAGFIKFENYLNPSDFISASNINNGLLYQHNFLVDIIPSASSKVEQNLSADDIRFNAIEVSVPGVTMGVTGSILAGRNRYYAQERTDQDLSITFLDDATLSIRRYFEKWIGIAYDPYTKTRNYPDQYKAASVDVYTMNQSGISQYLDQFIDPFPIEINDLDFSRSNYDVVKTKVTFKYYSHLVKTYSEMSKSIEE